MVKLLCIRNNRKIRGFWASKLRSRGWREGAGSSHRGWVKHKWTQQPATWSSARDGRGLFGTGVLLLRLKMFADTAGYRDVQFSSVAQSCLTLCNPMNQSTPGLLVHHQLPEFTQTHVHRVSDAIQPSHPLSSPSPPAPKSLPASRSFSMGQLFSWDGQSTGVSASALVLPMNTQDWFALGWTGWISLQSKWLSRVFSNTFVAFSWTVWKGCRDGAPANLCAITISIHHNPATCI